MAVYKRGHKPAYSWPKGVSGNPGGRPRGLQELQAAARDHAPEAVEKLVEFMRGAVTVGSKQRGVAPRLQVQAALAILDRGLGKPAQQLLANREATFDGPERVVVHVTDDRLIEHDDD